MTELDRRTTVEESSPPDVKENRSIGRTSPEVQSRDVGRLSRAWLRIGTSIVLALALWWLLADFVFNPVLFASPFDTASAIQASLASGELIGHIGASMNRILRGFLIGSAVAIPLGLVMGSSRTISELLNLPANFLRFVPPIAMLPVAIIWFGIGETSKVFLIVYSTFFIVLLNTMAGVRSIPEVKLWAAQSMGMKGFRLFTRVLVPATVPFMVTGMRLAMGGSFMTIVAAEMLAAESGLGYMIFSARQFFQTNRMFAGLFVLGALGLLTDQVFRLTSKRLLRRYGLHDS